MSLAELKDAVDALTAEELAELAAFTRAGDRCGSGEGAACGDVVGKRQLDEVFS